MVDKLALAEIVKRLWRGRKLDSSEMKNIKDKDASIYNFKRLILKYMMFPFVFLSIK